MADEPIRVLVVDDTAIYRKIVADVLQQVPEVEVVGRACNGQLALSQIDSLRPHLITLDVEMPVMDGLETLRQIQLRGLQVGVIMLSAQTAHSAQATVAALELGALDFVLKPTSGSLTENTNRLREALASRVLSLGRLQRTRCATRAAAAGRVAGAAAVGSPVLAPSPPLGSRFSSVRSMTPPQVVAVGISTGGPQALQRFMAALPADLGAPLLIVQHMPPVFTRSLANDLDKRCPLRVCEAEHGQPVLPGTAYIAPGGKQMKVSKVDGAVQIVVTDDPPENSCRPSVDYLFRSVAQTYQARVLALIMTGMGNDGALGCRLIKQGGGTILAQDEQSCVVFGMPRQPIEEGLVDAVGTPDRLAAEVTQLVRRKELSCR